MTKRDPALPRDAVFMPASLVRPQCPDCLGGRGVYRRTSLRHFQRVLTFECDCCLHEWSVAVYDPSRIPTRQD